MKRTTEFLLCGSLLLLLVLPAVQAQSAEPDEAVYSWRLDNAPPSYSLANQQTCSLLSATANPDESPCRIESYWMGNTDTHVFFRFNMGSLEWSDFGSESGAVATFKQDFQGTADGNKLWFSWEIKVDETSDKVSKVQFDGWSDPEDTGLVEVVVDRVAHTLTSKIPLEVVGAALAGGPTVGEWFNATSARAPRVDFETTQFGCTALFAQTCPSGVMAKERIQGNQTYYVQPYGELQPAPSVTFIDVDQWPQTFEFRDPTAFTPWVSWTNIYNWTLDKNGFELDFGATAESGSVELTLLERDGPALSTTTEHRFNQEFLSMPPGDWQIKVSYDRFVGNYSLNVKQIESPIDGSGQGPGTDGGPGDNGGGGDNDTGTGPDTESGEKKGIPGPGALLLAALGLAAHRVARSRRA